MLAYRKFTFLSLIALFSGCGKNSSFTGTADIIKQEPTGCPVTGDANGAVSPRNNLNGKCGGETSRISCTLTLDSAKITLGDSVKVKLSTSASGDIFVKINDIITKAETYLNFTPTTVGEFKFEGLVQNSKDSANCIDSVTVSPAVVPPVIIPPSCTLNATRNASNPTTCNVTITSTGGPITGDPIVAGITSLTPKSKGWEGIVSCNVAGETLTASVTNASSQSQCSTTVAEIQKPACIISLSSSQIELGQSVNATIHSTAGSVNATTVNGTPAQLDQAITITPNSIGPFTVTARVQNARSTESCVAIVTVRDRPQPIIPPSCTLTATRQSATSLKCDVTINSTGGPITTPPVIENAGLSMLNGTGYTGIVDCPAAGATIRATISNPAGSNSCSTQITSISQPSCQLVADKTNVTLGQSINVLLRSTGGPLTAAQLNSIATAPNQSVAFTPTTLGANTFTGRVDNPSGFATCTLNVNVERPVCTINPAYNPENIVCSIAAKSSNSIWANTAGWMTRVRDFSDSSARFISPLSAVSSNGIIRCPMVQEDMLVYVTHLQIPSDGMYKIESIIDDTGSVRLWKDGNPYQEKIVAGNTTTSVQLESGSYTIVVDAIDTGKAATGMTFSLRNSGGSILRNSHSVPNRPDSWCIFRTSRNTDLKTFVPDAGRCRVCFGG